MSGVDAGLEPVQGRAILLPKVAGYLRRFAAPVLLASCAVMAGGAAYAAAGGFTGGLLAFSALTSVGFALFALERHRALLAAREGARSYRDLYENISEGVFRSTLDGRMISANPSLVRLNGYETEEQLLKAVNSIADEWYVDPNRRGEIHRMLLKSGRLSNCVSEIYRHHTRERIWIEESVRLVRDKTTGEPLHYDGTVREVTETVRRLELQERYDKIASLVSGCLYQHRLRPDGSATMPYASIGLRHIFGVEPEDVAKDAAVLAGRIHPDDDHIIAR